MSTIWAVFWYLLGLALIGSAVILRFEFKVPIIFMQLPFIIIVCLCSHLIFTVYAYRKRAHFTNSIFYSSFNLLVWMVPVVVLGFLEIKQIMIPLCFYSIIALIQSLLKPCSRLSTWTTRVKWSLSFSSWCKRWWLLSKPTIKFSHPGKMYSSVMWCFSSSCLSVSFSWLRIWFTWNTWRTSKTWWSTNSLGPCLFTWIRFHFACYLLFLYFMYFWKLRFG